jgi:hypothetical protein
MALSKYSKQSLGKWSDIAGQSFNVHFVGFFSKGADQGISDCLRRASPKLRQWWQNLDLRPMGTPPAGVDHGQNDPTTTIRKDCGNGYE